MLRRVATCLCCAALLPVLCFNTAGTLNLYQDIFVNLSARPLAMGGAAVAIPQTASVFHNPAALSGVRALSIMWNHSARHFGYTRDFDEPGRGDRDQIDGDTQAIVVPLPLSVYAHGFTQLGEMGYDYRNHPPGGDFGFPREDFWGTESYDAFATSFGLPLAAGFAQRRSFHRFTPAVEDPVQLPWVRLGGKGHIWGLYARVMPGLDYGYSDMRHDYEWTVFSGTAGLELMQSPPATEPPEAPRTDMRGNPIGDETRLRGAEAAHLGFVPFSSVINVKRSGYAFRPAGWLLFAADDVTEKYRFRDAEPFYGWLHSGDQSRRRAHAGGELRLGWLAAYRWGSWDGRPTLGLELNLGGLRLNYAEARDLLPEIVGADGAGWRGIHIYGAELGLW